MKVSELKTVLDQLPRDCDPDVVTGESWLPERLIDHHLADNLLFLEFDRAPDECQHEEARGFVDHEIDLLGQHIREILRSDENQDTKADALLALFLLGHERTSSEIIELLDHAHSPQAEHV